MARRNLSLLFALALALALPPRARAQGGGVARTKTSATAVAEQKRSAVSLGLTPSKAGSSRAQRLPWPKHWPKIRWWEYPLAAAGFGILAYVQFGTHTSFRARWEGGILFDDGLRDGLRLSTRGGREAADLASDIFWGIAWAMPLVDMVVVPALDRNGTLFWQLAWMNAMVFGIVGATSRAMHKTTKRARPLMRGCAEEGPDYDKSCNGSPSDFFSGHTAMAAAAAGLTCVHHGFLPLYGRPWADTGACVAAATSAAAVGLFRIMADRHYTSSVLVGYAFGFAVGYGLPRLLHYRRPRSVAAESKRDADSPKGIQAMVTPLAGEQLGLQLVGRF